MTTDDNTESETLRKALAALDFVQGIARGEWDDGSGDNSNIIAAARELVGETVPDLDITIYPPDDIGEAQWAVIGDLRRVNDDYAEANYLAEKALKPQFPNIEFDPEMSCFYAYAASEADAQALVEAIKEWRG